MAKKKSIKKEDDIIIAETVFAKRIYDNATFFGKKTTIDHLIEKGDFVIITESEYKNLVNRNK